MAARDIMPWQSPHGGTTTVRWATFTASEVFEIGEPINIVAAGTATEPPDDVTQWILTDGGGNVEAGIAAWGPGAGNLNTMTGVAYATGDYIPYWPINEGTVFITKNFYAAGAGSAVAPDLTDIGNNFQISHATFGTPDAGWGIERTAGLEGIDYVATILDVLDAQKSPIRVSGNAGVYVTFLINGTLAAA